LVLDELGNSLGEVNRKDVLGALKRVAERQQVTILGTYQDSVLVDAADVCGELMWFSHASTSDAYNHATRVWGFDENSRRVELTANWLKAGRRDV
jgi:ATP:corrinoid adenosyltransferase